MSRIKVLHVTFDMAIAGTEQVIRQLVENTDPVKFDTSIMCIDGRIGDLGQELIKKGIKIDSIKREASGLDFGLIKTLKTYVKLNNIDVLHCHQYTPYVYGLFASLGTSTPVIFTEHGRFYPDSYKWKRVLLNPILSLFTSSITAISKATAEALIKYENFPRRKVTVIYNGIQFNPSSFSNNSNLRKELGIDKEANLLGTIARLDTIKNQSMMIEAFAQVVKHFPNSYLLIVGDGPEREPLEQLRKKLCIQERVIFTGFKINPQRFFNIIDIFLLPSLSEGTSMTLLEAMAFKKPAIVTDVGGNPEIVKHNVTGLVTPNKDMPAFSKAIQELLKDPTKANKLGLQGLNRYNQLFKAEEMVNKYQNLYLNFSKHNQ